jgi:hypothetical protein
VILLALAVPASEAAASRGVGVAGTIADPGIVSARAQGNLLYTSGVSGVSIYDISRPRAPVRIGRLELANVQNEDVDVGNGILLVSDDPYGGRGILHVIDVRDPRRPRLLSTYSTYAPGLLAAEPRRSRRRRGGIGHTASCIQACRYAWLAGSPDGIEVVDLRDPARPRFAGRVRAKAVSGLLSHDVQVDSRGLAWVAGGDGTAAYDTTNPVRPRLVTRTDRRGARSPYNDYIHHNSLRIADDTLLVTEEDFGDGCRRAGSFQTWRIRGPRARPLDRFGVERNDTARVACSAHYFDHSGGLVAAGFYEGGLRLLDVRNPRRIRQVGFHVPARSMFWAAVFAPGDPSVVYAIDHARGIDVLSLDRAALRPVRRRAVKRRRRPAGRVDVVAGVFDGLETARPGRRVQLDVVVGLSSGRLARDVEVEVQLPAALTRVRAPRGVSHDPATRRIRFVVGRLGRREVVRKVRGTLDPRAKLGSVAETIAYIRRPTDAFLVTNRAVDTTQIAKRTRRTRPDGFGASASGSMLCVYPALRG